MPNPAWLDQVLFDLQDPARLAGYSSWELEFLPSVSKQVAEGKLLTPKQQYSLLRMYRTHFPNRDPNTFRPFSEE